MKIGFIGVGNIGAPIAGQLLAAGHALVVHDLRHAATDALLAAGAAWAETPAAAVAECEVVATCLPAPPEMERVCLGPDGIVAHLKSGALYIDHTTNAPDLVRRGPPALGARGGEAAPAPARRRVRGRASREPSARGAGRPASLRASR